jgi:hypothetical protein
VKAPALDLRRGFVRSSLVMVLFEVVGVGVIYGGFFGGYLHQSLKRISGLIHRVSEVRGLSLTD